MLKHCSATKVINLTISRFWHQHVLQLRKTFLANMSHDARKPVFWFKTGSETNQAVQPKKMVRISVFRIKEEELLFYLFREYRFLMKGSYMKIKGADHLRSACTN